MPIVLASGSPRRREILAMITENFTVQRPLKDEIINPSLSPRELVEELSRQKANEVWENCPDCTVIGADTVVEMEGLILGKPKDAADAFKQLSMLSGGWHNVHTGVTFIINGEAQSFVSSSKVKFAVISENQVWDYIKTGEPMDKAGSYGVQGLGGKFIERIEGDFYSIMGLPLCDIYKFLVNNGHIA